ncbi:MAG: polyphosphate kinase 1 [Zetaproteobacteria bacterium]|nr:MAG: polyphosphate kinase 1 [Zetaproteobacteria bacterium]
MDLTDKALYLNRDLSMLAFHRRVLELAMDEHQPLLERLRFLCICSSNLDEFFEVRVAALKQRLAAGSQRTGPDGLGAETLLRRIRGEVEDLVGTQYALFNDTLVPALREEGVVFLRRADWNETQAGWIARFFRRELLPVITPIALDPAHPFPRLLNKILNFIVELEGKDAFGRRMRHAIVQAPRALPRVVRLPSGIAGAPHAYVFLSSIIHAHIGELFPGMQVTACHQFRVTRNSELYLHEEEAGDLKDAVAEELLERRFGSAVRLEVSTQCPLPLAHFLLQKFELCEEDLYRVDGPVNLYRLARVCDDVDRPDLKYDVFSPGLPPGIRQDDADLFEQIRRGDILLHHPFQSFEPVIRLLHQAAQDPQVLAIKQTLYRVVPDSPIVDALVRAAQANKEVVAVIELRARFNEQENIALADRLSAAGVQVVYGVVGYKTHCKMMLIVRREGRGVRRYVHLGTGNYHTTTTRLYTDYGLLSCARELGEDVHRIFQQLTGMGRVSKLKVMLQAPFSLHAGLLQRIRVEEANARAGGKARIIAKMNGLEEPEVIRALYRASQAGVKIDLIVRGICCLRPGIKGVSENIRVRSVLGRFLEHTRVFYFYNGGEPEVLCASADWMIRNLLRRVESCFPIRDPKLARQVLQHGLRYYLRDNQGAWRLRADGRYVRVRSRGKPFSAQQALLRELAGGRNLPG